jgi:orotate phosphoribosyltransferase
MDNIKEIIMDYSISKEAIKFNTENPFTWASGYKMPIYNDNRKLLSSAEIRSFITNEFKEFIVNSKYQVDIIAGTATSGIPFATSLADILNKPLVYVRGKAKEYGMGNAVEGYLPEYKYKKAILIEDVISTGRSALRAVERLTEQNIEVIDIFAIFDYEFLNVLKFQAIYTLSNLIEYIDKNKLEVDEKFYEEIKEWRKAPFIWRGKE